MLDHKFFITLTICFGFGSKTPSSKPVIGPHTNTNTTKLSSLSDWKMPNLQLSVEEQAMGSKNRRRGTVSAFSVDLRHPS